MSIFWVAKMAATLPLNLQEEHVKERLEELHVGYRSHEVFAIEKRSVVVDFFLPELNVAKMECWRSDSRRGIALAWIERNAAYIDLKFRRLKEQYPRSSSRREMNFRPS
jgi:hypothetical protein